MDKLEVTRNKILSNEHLKRSIASWNLMSKKVVFTNGCFDILHLGHVDYLAKAANLGQVLVIGLNTDESVRKLKGPGRPVQDETSRAMVLAALGFVSAVVLFDEETPLELIRLLQPDVLVKGGDYIPNEIVGYDIVKAKGGEVITFDFIEGYSSSSVLSRI
jgi:D-glycero-beta-D-manno-heptose 1-phosphate adenylyltransferase